MPKIKEGISNKELADFLLQQCNERGISLRSLSLKSGLSPGTVHNIINRKYQPTLYSLNQLADYLGVNRVYLWQLAGLLRITDIAHDPMLQATIVFWEDVAQRFTEHTIKYLKGLQDIKASKILGGDKDHV